MTTAYSLHFENTYYMQKQILSALSILTHLLLRQPSEVDNFCCSPNGETEARRDSIICPMSRS